MSDHKNLNYIPCNELGLGRVERPLLVGTGVGGIHLLILGPRSRELPVSYLGVEASLSTLLAGYLSLR